MNTYSGKFVLRLPQDRHRELARIAKKRGVSLNKLCSELIDLGLVQGGADLSPIEPLEIIAKQLKRHFRGGLLGVVLFGSQATGEATASSDIDLLIVLDKKIALVRSLYRWWDSNIEWNGNKELNPHFVNYPEKAEEAGGMWLEIAQYGQIIYQKNKMIDNVFKELKDMIAQGMVRQHSSNGHPYWVWRKNEK